MPSAPPGLGQLDAFRVLAMAALLACTGLLTACRPYAAPDEITVQRINVVDQAGEVRLVISGDLPDPVVRGQQVERAISPAGLIWHDEDGNESGGLVTAPLPGVGTQRGIVFDFTRQPTDAISMGTFESADGEEWMAGVLVFDRIPYAPGPIETTQGVRRILLGTHNEDAGLVILDPQERERIRIGVDPDGIAALEILDEHGQVIFRAP
jgi:hypothetical protein